MSATCSDIAISEEPKCPDLTTAVLAGKAKDALEAYFTIFEHCPECGKYGFSVNVTPVIWQCLNDVSKIKQLNFEITRPCGHCEIEFSIGF